MLWNIFSLIQYKIFFNTKSSEAKSCPLVMLKAVVCPCCFDLVVKEKKIKKGVY